MEHNIILNTKEVKIRYIEKLITNKLEEIYDNFIENEEDKNNEHYIILKTTPKLSNLIKLKLEKQINDKYNANIVIEFDKIIIKYCLVINDNSKVIEYDKKKSRNSWLTRPCPNNTHFRCKCKGSKIIRYKSNIKI